MNISTSNTEGARNIKGWIKKHPIWTTVILFFTIPFLVTMFSDNSSQNSDQQTSIETVKIGDNAFLRIPNVTDSKQVICLGTTKEAYEKVGEALLAKDIIGLLKIPGAFCVGNGTKVLVIDSGFGIRNVRIMEGVNSVDKDKFGMSGWVAMEFLSKN